MRKPSSKPPGQWSEKQERVSITGILGLQAGEHVKPTLDAQAAVQGRAAQRAYAVWYLHTYPTAPHTPAYAWQLLEPAKRALWDAIAQAVLAGHRDEDPHA